MGLSHLLRGIVVILALAGAAGCDRVSVHLVREPVVTLGGALAPDDTIPHEQQVDEFGPGEPIYLAVDVGDTPEGNIVWVVWYGVGDEKLGEEEKTVEAGKRRLAFQAPDTSAWAPGSYRAEVRIRDEKIAPRPFRITTGERGTERKELVSQTVFYGTDRAETGSKEHEKRFGTERSKGGELRFGVCKVSIPRDHRMGHIERPFLEVVFAPDPEKHMTIVDLTPLPRDAFFGRLGAAVGKSEQREALVFVHGFNVSFAEAVLRTAQIAYDLGFDGAPITYTWPSRSSLSKTGYHADETNAEWTAPHLERFLTEVAARSGARKIHLIAHSMGNRPLTAALRAMAAKMQPGARPLFEHIVLTAPDIDTDTFAQLALQFSRPGRRTTLYASSNDKALQFSRDIHGGYPRAGDSGRDVVVLHGIDTVEVSTVDTSLIGHSYYGDNRSVLSDLFGLIRDGKAPEKRFGLKPRSKGGLRYWIFQPS